MVKRVWRSVIAASVVSVATFSFAGVASADVPFAFVPDSTTLTESGPDAGVNGGHPDVTMAFRLQTDPAVGTGRVPQAVRTATVELPEGLVGDPRAATKTCPLEDVTANERKETAGRCPREAAVGTATVDATYPNGNMMPVRRQRLFRVPTGPSEVAAFSTTIASTPLRIAVTVSPSGGYRVRATADSLTQSGFVRGFSVTLWGVPADHQGRGPECDGVLFGTMTYCLDFLPVGTTPGFTFGDPLPGAERRPFLTNPSVCGASLDAKIRLVPYGTVFSPIEAMMSGGTVSGCENQPFDPAIDVTPKSKAAGQPSGYTVGIDVPQNMDPDGVGTAQVKDVSVTLPEGVAISPPSANGLDACSDAQLDLHGDSDPRCPDASSIGSVRIDTPVLEKPVMGRAYIGTQLSHDPASGEMYRLFLVAKTSGVLVKLKGAVQADPKTGQLTATFENNPQLPFSRIALTLDDGQRASLANPARCGTYTAKAQITSWAGQTRNIASSFAIDRRCPSGRFAPTLVAGMTGPWAGAFSPFTMTVGRADGDQDLSRINLTMPSGLLGALGSVPLCGAAQAQAGSCPAVSRIGSTTVSVGSGARPFTLPGRVYLAGPYKGAPFSLSIVVPAKAGPYDLGLVVVRARLVVDAAHASVSALSDRLPMIVGGVPIHMRMVNVTLDRPGFMFNATSCRRFQVAGSFVSPTGAVGTAAVPYQARRCDKLKLQPSLKIGLPGSKEFRKNGHPKLTADLSQTFGQTGLKRVKVVLPGMLALAADNAQELCKPAQAAARNCPKGSIVGHAIARTPALHLPLSGPVYFVENTRRSKEGRVVKTLPKLWLKLAGEGVALDLWATSEIDSSQKPQRLVTTFDAIPDAPIAGFRLEIDGGEHGILGATEAICALKRKEQKAEVTFTGQNDGVLERRVTIRPTDCRLDTVSKGVDSSRVKVRVSGIGAGKLTISGKGIRKTRRTIKRAHVASITARLTRSGKRMSRDRDAIRVKVSWDPKKEGEKTQSLRTTVKRAKQASSSRAHRAR